MVGTPYYISPDILNKNYNEKCDIWSCGVLLYALLSGTIPFGGNTDLDILQNVKKSPLKFEGDIWPNVSNEAKDLIKQMLNRNFNSRPTAAAILENVWFKKIRNPKESESNNQSQVILSNTLTNLNKFKLKNRFQ
jgi:calcium-dependent protein kinase